ncbi:phosphodiester glycosidase family protein [Tessaracoccus sp. OS52]|uniref:phosphodiester glycosidase family protein n=1 Tax=Tessaracoccus sp. OS52 TaxID=2886691 RepID=UPI001D1265BE|nr:phosphodiester glycosidase family protein [Tessaracoccus sp. OS52]MCC2591818.1 phosphodiester glycosidase family protein [Tessaracoccus sp. OS52]
MPSGLHPETAVGSTADGRLVMVVMDGQRNADTALGVNWVHVASYLKSLGVTDAILVDGGGSTEMVVRQPGDTQASIVNSPSDLAERPVTNGLFVYSTAEAPSAATNVVINDGAKLSTAVGAASKVPAYATDAAGNPSADPVQVSVNPSRLGTWDNGVFTPKNKGAGTLIARAGSAQTVISVKVAEQFSDLTISPDKLGVKNGESQEFVVQGSNGDEAPVTVEPSAVAWGLDNTDLGNLDASTGVFKAAASGNGGVQLSATVGGVGATADVRVGVVLKSLVVADSPADWEMTVTGPGATTVQQGHPGETTDVPADSTQEKALKVDFSFANTTEQNRIRLSPNNGAGVLADKNELGQVPENLFFKFKIDSPAPPQSWIVFNVRDAAGHYMGLWTALDPKQHYGKWVELSKSIKRGVFTDYPLTIQDISFVGQYATNASTGTFSLAELRVDYPAGTPADETPYEAISSNNPEWLIHEQDSANFKPGGETFIMGSDAHLRANIPDSTSAVTVENMTRRIKGESYTTTEGQTVAPLPEVARPEVTVSLGDTSDTGILTDLAYGKAMWEGFGAPLYNVVGNHEISNGPEPADGNFYSVFQQDTHFSFTRPGVTFIGVDNSTGSIQGSDSQQVPAEEQFPWFVEQLDAAETPVVFVGIHMPIHDPSPSKTSQASNRWEAEQFLEIIQNYREANPDKRVVVLHGHSRGFANLVLDPQGKPTDAGIPQLTIADVGTPPYYAADQGGFFHFGLLHVNPDGTVQFAVEPLLKSVAIDQGADDALAVGETKQYTATAVNTNGANIANPPVIPVATPMSHVWTSSNTAVATVDAVTGEVTATGAGSTTISVRTGGITASLALTVGAGTN